MLTYFWWNLTKIPYNLLIFFISDHTRLGHWILDGDPAHSHLLRFALTEDNFTDTTGKYKFPNIKSPQFYSWANLDFLWLSIHDLFFSSAMCCHDHSLEYNGPTEKLGQNPARSYWQTHIVSWNNQKTTEWK